MKAGNNHGEQRLWRAPGAGPIGEELGAHESEGSMDSRNLPRESSPTRRAEKAAREYGGVCSTESPDENVRLLMGGDVCAARYGSTERNVEGGISAGEKGVRISGRQEQGRWGGEGQHLPWWSRRYGISRPRASRDPRVCVTCDGHT